MDYEAMDPGMAGDGAMPPENDFGPPPRWEQASPLDYSISLTPERRQRIAARLCSWLESYYASTETERDSWRAWRRDHAVQPPGQAGPWPNSADIPSALTRIVVGQHSAKLDQQILDADPPFVVKARTPEAIEAAPQIEEAMTARFEEANWRRDGAKVHEELAIGGTTFVRVTYEIDKIRRPVVEIDVNLEDASTLTAAGVPPMDALYHAISTDKRGAPKRKLTFREEVTFAGARIKVIPWEEGVILPVSVRDPKDARAIGERVMISGMDLLHGARSRKYYRDEVDLLLERQSDPTPEDWEERYEIDGIEPGGPPAMDEEDGEELYRTYTCHEMNVRADWDGDGKEELYLVTVHADTRRLLQCRYDPHEHGRMRYTPMRYFESAGQLWGMGMAKLIAAYQDGDTNAICQIIDNADLINAAATMWLYTDAAGIDINKFEFRPGLSIRVEDTRDMVPMPVNPLPPQHYTVHQFFKDNVDLMTGTSNVSLGKETDTQKTLGEVQLVMGAANMQFERRAAQVALQWSPIFDQMRWLEAQYGENQQVTYRMTARSGVEIESRPGDQVAPDGSMLWRTVPGEILKADVDLVPSGLSALSDLQSRVSQATIVRNTVLTDPTVQQIIASGDVEVPFYLLDHYLQELRYAGRDKLMGMIREGHAKFRQQQALQAQLMAGMAGMGAGVPGQPTAQGLPPVQGPPPTAAQNGAGGAPELAAASGGPPGMMQP